MKRKRVSEVSEGESSKVWRVQHEAREVKKRGT